MNKKDAQDICKGIGEISRYIRFVGVIDKKGNLMAYQRRAGLKPLLNTKSTTSHFSHIAIKTGLEAQFDKQLGEVQFIWEERESAQTISFAVGKNKVWISIDKNVIRSEILRIIDSCLPVVRNYSS